MNRKVFWTFLGTALLLGASGFLVRKMKTQPFSSQILVEASSEQILHHIQDLHSPLVLVNFWASWCEPCKVEFPALLSVRKRMANKGLSVVFVSIDEPSDLADAEAFLRESQIDFKTFYKGTQPIKFVTQIYPKWEGEVPTSILMDQQLNIVDAWTGATSAAELEKRVALKMRGT